MLEKKSAIEDNKEELRQTVQEYKKFQNDLDRAKMDNDKKIEEIKVQNTLQIFFHSTFVNYKSNSAKMAHPNKQSYSCNIPYISHSYNSNIS